MSEADKRLPENLIPEARDFLQSAYQQTGENQGEFGHAARTLASTVLLRAMNRRSVEQQRELLKQNVEKLVEQFGPKILDFLGKKYALVLPEFEHLRQR